jgi:hypothetical protein
MLQMGAGGGDGYSQAWRPPPTDDAANSMNTGDRS